MWTSTAGRIRVSNHPASMNVCATPDLPAYMRSPLISPNWHNLQRLCVMQYLGLSLEDNDSSPIMGRKVAVLARLASKPG